MTRYRRLFLCTCAVLLAAAAAASSQVVNKTVKWSVLTPTVTGAPGEVVEVKIRAAIDAGFHMYTTRTYPDSLLSSPSPTVVTAGESGVISMAGRLKGTRPTSKYDDGFETTTEFWEGSPTLIVPVRISKKAKLGTMAAWVSFNFQTCNNKGCNPPTDRKLEFQLEVADKQAGVDSTPGHDTTIAEVIPPPPVDTAGTAPPQKVDTPSTAVAPATPAPPKAGIGNKRFGPTGTPEEIEAAKAEGLLAYIWLAAGMGLLSLMTPCVFPMIPITVSFFTKREQTTRKRTLRDAALYGLGIILTFTAIGFVVSVIFGATGVQNFATNAYVNLGMAAIFLVLALNLFGLFEIQVPTSVLNRLNRSANEGSGVGSVMLMGLVFSLTSFTCTVPFVGMMLGKASLGGDYFWPLLGTAAFATVFAFPFFLLALFPSMLKALPKSGGWLNSIKVVMGFIEVAFVVKFLAGSDMVLGWGVFSREFCLAIWISIAVLTTVYLLGRYQLPHDTPVTKVGPIRVLFAIGSLALGFWMLTGMFGANLGELEAQLPLAVKGASTATASIGGTKAQEGEAVWLQDNYEEALARGRREGKPIFIDFTGYFCTNCRWMERNMFNRPDVSGEMQKFILVRLYTDGKEPVNKKNLSLLVDRFQTITVPYYAIFNADGKVVAKFGGMTREAEQFLDFLHNGSAAQAPLADGSH